MKLVLCLFLLSQTSLINGQQMDEIYQALQDGNVDVISEYMHPRVEVNILDKVSVYQRNGATRILKRFYRDLTPISFKRIHRGQSRSQNSVYTIGKLSTDQGEFRMYLYVKRMGEKVVIQELRIDQE